MSNQNDNIIWWDFEKSLAEYQESIYLRRSNFEADIEASENMIKSFENEIIEHKKQLEQKTKIVEVMQKQLTEKHKEFNEEFGS